MYIYLYIRQMCASASRLVVRHHCCVKVLFTLFCSVGTVLIFQFSPSIGSGSSVLVPTCRYQGTGTRFSGGYLHLSHFGTETGTLTAPNFWNQNTEDAVLSLFLVLDQHYCLVLYANTVYCIASHITKPVGLTHVGNSKVVFMN